MDILSNPNISDSEKRRLITEYTDGLIREKKYEEAASTLQNLLYSGVPYIDQRIMDEELRAYAIFAGALMTEAKYEKEPLPLIALKNEKRFVQAILNIKLALRRIWFDIPGANESLLEAVKKYHVGAALIVEVSRCSVPEALIAPVIKKCSEYLKKSSPADSTMLNAFADALGGGTKPSPAPHSTGDASFAMRNIDASKQPEDEAVDDDIDEKSIAIIACANDRQYVSEITEYLRSLDYPEGFRAEAIFVWNAPSMTAGYNLAMKSSRARYKIYIHQDVFITDREFIAKIIGFFGENDYDMLGIAGGTRMPDSGKWAMIGPDEGHICLMHDLRYTVAAVKVNPVGKAELKTVDGVFIATRVDVPWRDDLFTNFHFYDVSQCMEFARRGLKAGYFDNGGEPGLLHEVSFNYTDEYDEIYDREREKFLSEYEQDIKCT